MNLSIREAYGEALKEFGAVNQDVVVLDADLAGSTKSCIFGDAFPERFFNCGIAEYAMFGMAGGLAKGGKIPFANTFAVFVSTIGALPARQLMSYSDLNIKMAGAYGGLSDAFDGPSHHSLEDISIMRSFPNITVMVPSDDVMTRWMVKTCINTYGPIYLRLSRDAFPRQYSQDTLFEIGKAQTIRNGTDATIIACGIMVSKALAAAEELANEGVSVRVVDMFTIKPIDKETILRCAEETKAIVTAEEHSIIGGLGSAVAEVLAVNRKNIPFGMVGMQDTHAESGKYSDLLSKYHLDIADIKKQVTDLL